MTIIGIFLDKQASIERYPLQEQGYRKTSSMHQHGLQLKVWQMQNYDESWIRFSA